MPTYSFDTPTPPAQVRSLFAQTSWAADRTTEDIARALEASWAVLGVWEDDQLVGFGRLISDGVYRALLDDIVVDKSQRGAGIGGEIVRRLLERAADIEEVCLSTGPNLEGFYGAHGFKAYGGMHMKKGKGDGNGEGEAC